MGKPFNINDYSTLDELADAIEAEPVPTDPRRRYEGGYDSPLRQWFLDALRGKLPEQQKTEKETGQ